MIAANSFATDGFSATDNTVRISSNLYVDWRDDSISFDREERNEVKRLNYEIGNFPVPSTLQVSAKFWRMKRMVAQLYEAAKPTYDEEEQGEVVGIGQHHGGNIQVYIAHKVAKLREVQAQNWKADQASTIFKGCIMYVNGLTDPPIEELRRLIGIHGGECIAYRAVKITHLVCNYFTDAQLKSEHAKVKLNVGNRVHYVMAAWVTDSIRQGRRLDENEYAPRGVAKQHGATISSMFQQSAPAVATGSSCMGRGSGDSNSGNSRIGSSSSSSGMDGRDVISSVSGGSKVRQGDLPSLASSTGGVVSIVDLIDEQPPGSMLGSQDALLTASQHSFLDSLPSDLRGDALEQLRALRGLTTGGQVTRDKSSSGDDCRMEVESSGAVAKNDAGGRAEELSRLVAHLHHNQDGRCCSSKEVRQRAQGYVLQLLAALSGVDNLAAESVTLPARSALHDLLEDYVRWLLRGYYFDQAQFFCDELLRRTRSALLAATAAAPRHVQQNMRQLEQLALSLYSRVQAALNKSQPT